MHLMSVQLKMKKRVRSTFFAYFVTFQSLGASLPDKRLIDMKQRGGETGVKVDSSKITTAVGGNGHWVALSSCTERLCCSSSPPAGSSVKEVWFSLCIRSTDGGGKVERKKSGER
ncbi:Hypothetical predicted protein [Scomber scombrus]|uniref:Secreted protein n=1 Tax=Scomber scombrus TaxID=13677 RepID=A0AAV1Q8J1_SCOSC